MVEAGSEVEADSEVGSVVAEAEESGISGGWGVVVARD